MICYAIRNRDHNEWWDGMSGWARFKNKTNRWTSSDREYALRHLRRLRSHAKQFRHVRLNLVLVKITQKDHVDEFSRGISVALDYISRIVGNVYYDPAAEKYHNAVCNCIKMMTVQEVEAFDARCTPPPR
jgi:hypothetical protein